jgi:hypothetical protein
MTEFNLNKYQTQMALYNEPSFEEDERYEPYLFGAKYIWFGFKENACDNLDNIIEND